MALILDLLKSDVSPLHVFSWLENAVPHEELKEIFKTDNEEARISFPLLLSAFVREKSSRVLKWHNVAPEEQKTPKNKQEGLISGVRDLSLSSPIIHNKQCTPSQETRKMRKIQPHRLDLQDSMAFPSLGQSPKIKELPKKRRINPTQLQEVQTPTKQQFVAGFSPKPSPPSVKSIFISAKEQIGQKNLDQERALLKEKKQQFATISSVPRLGGNLPKSWSCVEPDIKQLTHQSLLDRLAALYAHCLTNHSLPMLYGEIKLLLELLVLRVSPSRCHFLNTDETSLLDSVHNCVYFSSKTLEKLNTIWCNVDRGFLLQLMSNARLALFSPVWTQHDLKELLCISCERTARPLKTISNVAFKTDTDNRFNFASDTSFQTFRKQRDLFCEIWQIWKANNSTPGWNTALGLRKMIQSLMEMKKDCVNYVHLARLFRSQLLDVAQLVEMDTDEESDLFLSQLQSSDPDKLRRLKERLTNPSENSISRTGAIDTPYKLAFEGDQEFFRDFIILASSPTFNEHLKNSLISGIEELSRSEDFDDQERFADTVIALQVMAKFLAFLRFCPHLSEDHLPEHIFHHLSELRSTQKEPIDLLGHVSDAYIEGRLILTVPWIVTYFSMADPVSLCLPDCYPALGCLVFVYRGADFQPKSAFFVRMLLSWLFDQPNFPRSLLAMPSDELQSLFRLQTSNEKKRARLDNCPLVTSNLIYQCCPFIMTWKHLLTDFACLDAKSHTEKSAFTRKITPISADESPSPTKARTVKPLQCSLEENFFHNQPSSVKRTVEFVAERLASNIVRNIRHQIIPCLMHSAHADLKSWPRDQDGSRIEKLSRELCCSVRKEAASTANTAVSCVDATLGALLPNDLLPAVREVCLAITTKLTREKVLDWLNLHVTLGLFKSDLETEWTKLDKASKRNEPPEVAAVKPVLPSVHDDSTWPPSALVDRLKTLIRQIVRDETNVSRQDVAELLSRAEGTLLRRVDIMPAVFRCLQQLTFDFLFILCVFQPESVAPDAIVAWVDFWKRTYGYVELPASSTDNVDEAAVSTSTTNSWLVFAPKHLLLLAQSTSARESWSHISTLILQLLKSELLRYEDVHEQAVAVLRQEWPQELLARFASCINDVVDWHRSQTRISAASPGDGKATVDDELLSWLSWFCAQEDLV